MLLPLAGYGTGVTPPPSVEVPLDPRFEVEQAAVWVRQYFAQNRPNAMWRVSRVMISPKKRNRIVVTVRVPPKRHAETIRRADAKMKAAYARMVCPPKKSEIDKALGEFATLWITLIHRGQKLVSAECKY